MAETGALEVYLNDHLAGGTAAVELIDTIRSNNEGTPLDAHLAGLGSDVEADKATLGRIMEALGVPESAVKQAGGKVLERLSRLRLNERVTGSAAVSRLMEIETLSLGIEGKLALLRSLQTIVGSRPELAAFDLPRLAERAIAQRAGLEPHRLEAAAEALAPS
jgi:hypothetical protein